MNKKILFDFDGTLVQSENILLAMYNELFEGKDYKDITQEDIEKLRSYSLIDKCKMLGISVYKIPKLYIESKKIYKKYLSSVELKDGVANMLHELKDQGFNLDILSSNDASTISEFVKNNDIDLFDHIYSSNNLFGKHHAIKNYLKKHNLTEKDIWYVGDEVRDIVSCKKAGVKIIAVTWGYDSEQILSEEKPDYLARKPQEILDILLN
ncbi:HAD-IA family hydrolase [Acetivibrio clariflavus]|uniref:Haloacid dehalogenase superfamily enzyme, subfamily IA n=1 Tax=Acetivibrio clariflavus (strain DSM 19732 / NBRC 101661 / EBR45) TaxID=720554 RepID=G8M2M9_ACECE|nr:HAD-IA family hydrolase [Acetivibrio clariflavus]AEV67103.1 haloacid dehalogenase superfamily enzyme, subfamily IA [Acetivibrio clariflavus DSM 19732]HOQ01014.1 HAD-IA family hydrolase [Acetivibrio clariflavus]HPU41086.1 HAD-IA family hydrolase [Acetivibrio clariflavus]